MRVVLLALFGCSSPLQIYSLDELPVEDWTGGLPVRGDGKLLVALSQRGDWSAARGVVGFTCDDCTLGDDRAKLDLGDFGAVEFQHLTFDTVRMRAEFRDGLVRVTSQWRSRDMTLDADIDGVLAPRAEDIELAGCVVFRPTDALRERDPRMHSLLSVTGAPSDDDGQFYIRLSGTLGAMRRRGEICEL